ncbi:MAG: gliding motility-associated C-terminal domain-containing protein [Bacteroidales bacterium]
MNKAFPLIIVFCLLLNLANAQLLPVDLVCTSVETNGDVTLTWRPKYSTFDFARYEVWYSVNRALPFNKIAEITDIAQNQYTHAGANAHLQNAFYYVKTIAISQATALSDTIAALLVEGQLVNQTYVQLKWNELMPHLPASNYGFYRVYWQKSGNQWILLDSVSETNFSHKVLPCSDNYYRIEMGDQSCISQSASIKVDRDIEQPPTPQLDSVSVVDGKVVIGWKPSPAPDVAGYVIYRQNAGIWDTLVLLDGASQRFYVDTSALPQLYSYRYCVAAFDRCGNASADMGIPQAQQTIYLQEPTFDVCGDKITLNWSPYSNMTAGLKGYRVLVRESADLEYVLATTGPQTLQYIFNQPLNGVSYSFRIQAYNEGDTITSSSNQQSLSVRKPPLPAFAYIRNVTVLQNQYIALQTYADTMAPVTEYRLYRSNPSNGNFDLLDVFDANHVMLPYTDTAVNVHKRQYFYKLAIIDSCGNTAVVSNVANNLLLSNPTGTTLEWTPYEGWDAGVDTYQVYKITEQDTSLAADVGLATTWTDDQMDYATDASYFVKALESVGNQYGFKEEAVSNTVQVLAKFSMAIANAFTPWREINNVFKPRLISFDPTEYYFAIYNRFGQKIFETTSPDEGWDGTVKGKRAPSGVYVYYLRVLTNKGRYIDQRGAVALID